MKIKFYLWNFTKCPGIIKYFLVKPTYAGNPVDDKLNLMVDNFNAFFLFFGKKKLIRTFKDYPPLK